jgi:hypothetical protein
MKTSLRLGLIAGTTAALFTAGAALSQNPPFGAEEDIAYAATLWDALNAAKLVGPDKILTRPYEGTEPHGFMLETLFDEITVEGHTGAVVVKRNYGPEGVSLEEVANNPTEHLAAITVMFQRDEGYDPETHNWFWVKYLPDGSLDQNPAGMKLAGLVGKGGDAGCIPCHTAAPGEDFLYSTDRQLQ